jgi:hypothetical protein
MGSKYTEDPLSSQNVSAKYLCKIAVAKLGNIKHEESSKRGIGLYLYVLAATSFL